MGLLSAFQIIPLFDIHSTHIYWMRTLCRSSINTLWFSPFTGCFCHHGTWLGSLLLLAASAIMGPGWVAIMGPGWVVMVWDILEGRVPLTVIHFLREDTMWGVGLRLLGRAACRSDQLSSSCWQWELPPLFFLLTFRLWPLLEKL